MSRYVACEEEPDHQITTCVMSGPGPPTVVILSGDAPPLPTPGEPIDLPPPSLMTAQEQEELAQLQLAQRMYELDLLSTPRQQPPHTARSGQSGFTTEGSVHSQPPPLYTYPPWAFDPPSVQKPSTRCQTLCQAVWTLVGLFVLALIIMLTVAFQNMPTSGQQISSIISTADSTTQQASANLLASTLSVQDFMTRFNQYGVMGHFFVPGPNGAAPVWPSAPTPSPPPSPNKKFDPIEIDIPLPGNTGSGDGNSTCVNATQTA